DRRHAQLFQRDDRLRDKTKDRAHAAMLKKDIAAKTGHAAQFVSKIEIEPRFHFIALLLINDLIEHLAIRFRRDDGMAGRHEVAAYAQHGWSADYHMKIRCALAQGLAEILIYHCHY